MTKKRLPKAVKKCLEKATDSALLAIETYNKPAIRFKSGGFIVLMIIAWTALYHAILFRRKIKPFYKENKRYIKRDGDFCYWELDKCLLEYFGSDSANAIRKNLEFFIPLRNIIEHKSLPEIDSDIFAECQAMVLNFDKVVEKEFGMEYCIRESLSFSIQLYPSAKNLIDAVISNPSAKPAVDFVKNYRSSISTDILSSGEYAFKAFLIQVANHNSSNALPIQFILYDKLSPEEKTNVERIAALVKNKHVPVSNLDLLKPATVVKKVQLGLGNRKVNRRGKQIDMFTMDTHTRCWKKYSVRPDSGAENPAVTNANYCVYDLPNTQYLYTESWIDYLIEKLSQEVEYSGLFIKVAEEEMSI